MKNESILNTSWRILRNSQLVWLFTLIYSVSFAFVNPTIQGGISISPLLGFVVLIWLMALLITPIAITITLHHGYLGKPAQIMEVVTGIKKYLFRWLGIFILTEFPIAIILAGFLSIFFNGINFMLYTFLLNQLGCFFLTFFFMYTQLGMIRNDLGIRAALKHGFALWHTRLNVKALIALLVAIAHVLAGIFIVLSAKGFSLISLSMNNRDYAVILKSLIPLLPLQIFYGLSYPILYAVIISAYFEDLRLITAQATS